MRQGCKSWCHGCLILLQAWGQLGKPHSASVRRSRHSRWPPIPWRQCVSCGSWWTACTPPACQSSCRCTECGRFGGKGFLLSPYGITDVNSTARWPLHAGSDCNTRKTHGLCCHQASLILLVPTGCYRYNTASQRRGSQILGTLPHCWVSMGTSTTGACARAAAAVVCPHLAPSWLSLWSTSRPSWQLATRETSAELHAA